jgi:hypothetical protein
MNTFWLIMISIGISCIGVGIWVVCTSNDREYHQSIQKRLKVYAERAK